MTARSHSDEDIELHEEVEVRRKKGSGLVAVRLSSELLHRVQAFAQERGLTMSDVLRMGAERVVQEHASTGTAITMRVASWAGGLAATTASDTRGELVTSA